MPRWNAKETEGLRIIRSRLSEELAAAPNHPEVVGDRKIIRYLRGHNYDIDKVTDMMRRFLLWRKENNLDEIRNRIIFGDCDHPLRFPKGEIILSKIRQIPIAPDALDHHQCPICLEQYDFSPSEVLGSISLQDYTLFSIYCLEYRSIILEQLSEEREQRHLLSLPPDRRRLLDEADSPSDPYGVLSYICVIRDLGGVGWEHLGPQGLDIIKSIVGIASANYPELMRKCYMINVPWIFNTAWYFIKGLLAERTVAKIAVLGSSFLSEVLSDVPITSIPSLVGGKYEGFGQYKPFRFDRRYFSAGITQLYEEVLLPPASTTAEEEEEEDSDREGEGEGEEAVNPSGASSYASSSNTSKLLPATSSLPTPPLSANSSSYSITSSSTNTNTTTTTSAADNRDTDKIPPKPPAAKTPTKANTTATATATATGTMTMTMTGSNRGVEAVTAAPRSMVTMLESSTPPKRKEVEIDVISLQTCGY